jgi:hypothetical protein
VVVVVVVDGDVVTEGPTEATADVAEAITTGYVWQILPAT